jgi:hypothetical protein
MLCFRAKPGPGLSRPLGLRTRTRLKFVPLPVPREDSDRRSLARLRTHVRPEITRHASSDSLASQGKLSLPVSSLDLPSWLRGVLMGTVGQG